MSNTEKVYEVEAIVGDELINGEIRYKVKWKGYRSDEDTWEPKSGLDHLPLWDAYERDRLLKAIGLSTHILFFVM